MTRILQVLGVVAALGVAVGVFLPLASYPVYGDLSYHRVNQFGAWLVLAFALAALPLFFVFKRRLVFLSPLAVWCTLLYPTIKEKLTEKEQGVLGKALQSVTDPLNELATDLVWDITEFGPGGYVFAGSCIVLTITAVMASWRGFTKPA